MVEFAMEMPTFSGTTRTPCHKNSELSQEELKKFLDITGWTYKHYLNHEKMYNPNIGASFLVPSTSNEPQIESKNSDISCNVENLELNSPTTKTSLLNNVEESVCKVTVNLAAPEKVLANGTGAANDNTSEINLTNSTIANFDRPTEITYKFVTEPNKDITNEKYLVEESEPQVKNTAKAVQENSSSNDAESLKKAISGINKIQFNSKTFEIDSKTDIDAHSGNETIGTSEVVLDNSNKKNTVVNFKRIIIENPKDCSDNEIKMNTASTSKNIIDVVENTNAGNCEYTTQTKASEISSIQKIATETPNETVTEEYLLQKATENPKDTGKSSEFHLQLDERNTEILEKDAVSERHLGIETIDDHEIGSENDINIIDEVAFKNCLENKIGRDIVDSKVIEANLGNKSLDNLEMDTENNTKKVTNVSLEIKTRECFEVCIKSIPKAVTQEMENKSSEPSKNVAENISDVCLHNGTTESSVITTPSPTLKVTEGNLGTKAAKITIKGNHNPKETLKTDTESVSETYLETKKIGVIKNDKENTIKNNEVDFGDNISGNLTYCFKNEVNKETCIEKDMEINLEKDNVTEKTMEKSDTGFIKATVNYSEISSQINLENEIIAKNASDKINEVDNEFQIRKCVANSENTTEISSDNNYKTKMRPESMVIPDNVENNINENSTASDQQLNIKSAEPTTIASDLKVDAENIDSNKNKIEGPLTETAEDRKENLVVGNETCTTLDTKNDTTNNMPLSISQIDIQSVCSILDEYSDGFKDEFSISSSSNNGDTNSEFLRKIDDFINEKSPENSDDEKENDDEFTHIEIEDIPEQKKEEQLVRDKERSLSPLPEVSVKNDDEVRSQLRLQLSLLRSKKKPADLLRRNIPVEYNSPLTDYSKKVFAPFPQIVTPSLKEVVLSNNDTRFQILNVMGGVGLKDTKEPLEYTRITRGHIIKPSKTQDITKIKGWRTKKFIDNFSNLIPPIYVTAGERRLLRIEDIVFKYDCKHGEPVATTSTDATTPCPVFYKNEQQSVSNHFPVKEEVTEETIEIDGITVPIAPVLMKITESQNRMDRENEKKSAFISDALDEFLSQNCKLNISYEVPKLVAEETISNPQIDDNLFKKNPIKNLRGKKGNEQFPLASKAKPKTLAEKRRMMEQAKETNIKNAMEDKNSELMLKLEAKTSKKQDYEFVKFVLTHENIPFSKECWQTASSKTDTRQYVTFNGTKLFVTAATPKEGEICTIVQKENLPEQPIKENLHENLEVPTNQLAPKATQYCRAGPLSKKPILGYDSNKWVPVLKTLPTVKLEVCPELGKPLPNKIANLLMVHVLNDVVDYSRARFAASAIYVPRKEDKNADKEPTPIQKEVSVFDIPYINNQTKILMRKSQACLNISESLEKAISETTSHNASIFEDHLALVPRLTSTEQCNDKIVCKVVENMIDFVVNKEDYDQLNITYDDSQEGIIEENSLRPPSPLPSIVSTIIKQPNPRRSKTSVELRRLNVQFIEVDVQDESEEITNNTCSKPYCSMGCVCSSLQGPSNNLFTHCGRTECMFKCDCEFETKGKGHHKVTLPAGTDVLSAGTMVRLEDEAKRHLAKEEKKFTQTVIRANNQTIVVGSGLRDRSRRRSKVPVKFTYPASATTQFTPWSYPDKTIFRMHQKTNETSAATKPLNIKEFVKPKLWSQDQEMEQQPPKISKAKAKAMKKALMRFKGVTNSMQPKVKLQKLPIGNLIPFCLIHKFYRCKCGLKQIMPHDEADTSLQKTAPKEQLEAAGDISIEDNSDPLLVPYKVIRVAETKRASIAERANILQSEGQTCARTRGVPKSRYLERNASEVYRIRYRMLKQQQKEREIHAYMNLKLNKDVAKTGASEPAEVVTTPVTQMKTRMERTAPRRYSPDLKAKQARTSSSPPTTPKEDPMHSLANLIDFETSNSLLLKPTNALNQEFQQMLGLKGNSKIPFRLLGWKHLVEKYKQRTLHLWFADHAKGGRLVITETSKKPQKNYRPVSDFESMTDPSKIEQDVIRFLITNTLPNGASSADDIFVVLAYTQHNWEIKGIFERKPGNRKSFVESSVVPAASDGHGTAPTTEARPKGSLASPSKNASRGIQLCKNRWNVIELRSELEDVGLFPLNTDLKQKARNGLHILNREVISARLPPIRYGKWWVVPLQDNFSLLSLPSSSITMKYNELVQLTRISKKCDMTIHARHATKVNRKPGYFGIFAVPETSEKIFIGPYGPNQKTDCELLGYVGDNNMNNVELYSSMKTLEDASGKGERSTGKWFFQISVVGSKKLIPKQPSTPLLDPSLTALMTNINEEPSQDNDVQIISEDPEVIDLTQWDDEGDEAGEKKEKESQEMSRRNKRKQNFPKIEYEPLIKVRKDEISAKSAADSVPPAAANIASANDITLIGFDNVDTKNMEVLSRQTTNRVIKYFTTNISGLGFMEAFYHSNWKFIDVYWPLTEEYWRFRKVEMAVKFIKELLKRRILFFPADYVVDIMLLDRYPKGQYKLRPEILEGFHMVSDNKLFDIRKTTYADFIAMGLCRDDYLKMVRKKCFALLNQEAKALGQVFLSPEVLKSTPNSQIVDKAYFEIKRLQRQEQDLVNQKIQLTKDKEGLIISYGTIIDPLPHARKMVAQRMLLRILRNKKPGSNTDVGTSGISDYVKQEILETPDFIAPNVIMRPIPPSQLRHLQSAASQRSDSSQLPQIVSVSSSIGLDEAIKDDSGAILSVLDSGVTTGGVRYVPQQVAAVGSSPAAATMTVADFKSGNSQNFMSILKNPNNQTILSKLPTSVANNILNKPGFLKLVPNSSSTAGVAAGRNTISMKRPSPGQADPSSSPNKKVRLVDPSRVFKLQPPTTGGGTIKLIPVPVSTGIGSAPNFLQRMAQRNPTATKDILSTRSSEGQISKISLASPSGQPKGYQLKSVVVNSPTGQKTVQIHTTPKSLFIGADKMIPAKKRFVSIPKLTPQGMSSPTPLMQINNPWLAEKQASSLPPPPTLTPAPSVPYKDFSNSTGRMSSSPPPPVLSPQPPIIVNPSSPPQLEKFPFDGNPKAKKRS